MKPLDFTINGVGYRIETDDQLQAVMQATVATLPAVLAQLPHTGKTQAAT